MLLTPLPSLLACVSGGVGCGDGGQSTLMFIVAMGFVLLMLWRFGLMPSWSVDS